jgi:hypothetical protein
MSAGLVTITILAGAFFIFRQNVKLVGETDCSSSMANATDTRSQLTEAECSRLLSRLDKDSDAAERENSFGSTFVRLPGPLGLGICPFVPRLRVCTLHPESFHGVFFSPSIHFL